MRSLVLIALLALAAPLHAQRINLDFGDLASKADEVIDVTLDGSMLRLAAKFLSNSPEELAVRDMVNKLTGIYVRSYSFDTDWEYDRGIVDQVRRQLGPNWKKIVNVRSKTRDNVEIYTEARGEQITGLVVIAADKRELTIVNIVGPIDLEKLASLEGEFGIPRITTTEKKNRD